MSGYDTYVSRVNIHGTTDRDRAREKSKDLLSRLFAKSPSVRTTSTSTGTQDLMILSTDKPETKKISSAPDDSFSVGEYRTFNGENWLINAVDKDDDFLTSGKMTLCPVQFVLQSSTTRIYTYPYYVISSSSSIDEGQNLMTPDGIRKVALPFDEITENLCRDKRLMGETFNGIPQCWKIIDLDSDSTKGLLVLTLRADLYNSESDNDNLRICDYAEPSGYSTTPPTFGSRVEIEYRGSATIKIGGSKKEFTAVFYDSNGEVDYPIVADWTISVPQDITDKIIYETITADDTTTSFKVSAINDSSLDGELLSITATERGIGSPRTVTITAEVVNAL
jgi:hypothetical protein